MPAMEMMYRVRAPDVSSDLRPGDIVDFTIDAAKYTILRTLQKSESCDSLGFSKRMIRS